MYNALLCAVNVIQNVCACEFGCSSVRVLVNLLFKPGLILLLYVLIWNNTVDNYGVPIYYNTACFCSYTIKYASVFAVY